MVARKVEEETKKCSDAFEKDVIKNTKNEKYIVKLPSQGIPKDELIQTVNRYLDLGKTLVFILNYIKRCK